MLDGVLGRAASNACVHVDRACCCVVAVSPMSGTRAHGTALMRCAVRVVEDRVEADDVVNASLKIRLVTSKTTRTLGHVPIHVPIHVPTPALVAKVAPAQRPSSLSAPSGCRVAMPSRRRVDRRDRFCEFTGTAVATDPTGCSLRSPRRTALLIWLTAAWARGVDNARRVRRSRLFGGRAAFSGSYNAAGEV